METYDNKQRQQISIPTQCLGCGAPQAGVQDGITVYQCGSALWIVRGQVEVMHRGSMCRRVVARVRFELKAERVNA